MNRFILRQSIVSAVVTVGIAALMWACGSSKESPQKENAVEPAAKTAAVSEAAAEPDRVDVIYFHGNKRCATCNGIQKAVEETVAEQFAQAEDAGMLVFEVRNFEAAENRALAEKYQVAFSTLVVAVRAGETVLRWETADKLWDHAHAPDKLKQHVAQKIRTALKSLGVE